MGLIHLPEIEDYWKASWVSEVPYFPRVISRDRFEMIFSMLHIGKTQDNQPCQKIDKVKLLLDLLIPTFQQSYDVDNAIAIDETMVGFRGSFAGKQYMPQKPTKWGVKAFTMATGFMINILPYMGAETLCNANPSFAHLPQPARVFLELITPYLHCGHHLYTDRYYTSVQLAQELHNHGTFFTGVCNKNCTELPNEIRSTHARRSYACLSE